VSTAEAPRIRLSFTRERHSHPTYLMLIPTVLNRSHFEKLCNRLVRWRASARHSLAKPNDGRTITIRLVTITLVQESRIFALDRILDVRYGAAEL